MKNFRFILSANKDFALGYKNDLVYSFKSDLSNFKKVTDNQRIIMGKNTYLSLPGILPNREHYVMTKEKFENVRCIKNISEVPQDDKINFIIGGVSMFREFLPLCSYIYLTMVEDSGKPYDVSVPFIFEALSEFTLDYSHDIKDINRKDGKEYQLYYRYYKRM